MTTVASREPVRMMDGSTTYVVGMAATQPGDTVLVSVAERPCGVHFHGCCEELIECRPSEDGLTQVGASPWNDRNDSSVHPDLSGEEAEYLRIARRVLSLIPRGREIRISASVSRTPSEDRVVASVRFTNEPDGLPGVDLPVDDSILDHIPGVRYLERRAEIFHEKFEVEAYDDASGISGEFYMNITPSSMCIVREDPSDDVTMRIESMLREDGVWTHSTAVEAVEADTDAMSELRRRKDPDGALEELFARDGAEDASETSIMQTMLGIGTSTRATVLSVERSGEQGGMTRFLLEPGLLR